jgi:CshA-type fibril repeat protein
MLNSHDGVVMSIFTTVTKSLRKKGLVALLVTAAQLAVSFSPIAASAPAQAATLDVSGKAFSFRQTNRTLSSSPAPTALNGYSVYDHVTSVDGIDIDAKITTVALTNATITNYDANGNASANLDAFQIDNNATAVDAKTTFKFEFFDHATGNPVVLKNVTITSIDLDSPGRQFAEFSSFQGYKLSTDTKMSAYTTLANGSTQLPDGLVRFIQTRTNTAASSNNDPFAAVEVDFAQLSAFNVSFGNEVSGQGGYFGLTFGTLCATATGSACTAAAAVNNPNNSAPTTNNTSLNYLNDGTTWTTIPADNFPYADADLNPFVQIKVTSLPASGTLQRFTNGAWVDVALNDVISATDINSGYIRYKGTADASFGFQVYDGLSYSTTSTVSLVASLTAQTITFAQPSNKAPNFSTFGSNATASSGLTVVLTSNTPSVCTVSGLNIVAVSGASGTCTITASQPGSVSSPFTYAAAVSVTRSFQVSSLVAQTITLANPADQTWTGSSFAVSPAPAVGEDATSHLAVTVVSLTSSICTVTYSAHGSTAAVTILGTGNCQLRATQAGDSTYAPATPVVVSFNIASSGSPSYTVTFNNNGGSGTMTAQSASSATNLTANTFTNTGYTFGGWSTTANGSLAYANSASYAFTSSTTLYAIWTAVTTYTVTFNNNGGSGTMTAQSASSATNLTANTFTNTGYTFGGWSTTANGSLAYANSASYAFTSSTTLYAIWTAVTTYTVTFNNNGGSGTMTAQSASSATNLTANTFTNTGYTFGGWSTTANGSLAYANSASYPFTSSTTLYAIWTANSSAPATPAAPTVTVPGATTVGTTPVTLSPSITAPGGIGSKCLVDPADGVCKQTVTLPGKGTFVLNSNGTVTFTAVLGWVGTATVQFRVTDASGQSAEAPVTVTVTAPAAPTVTGGTGTTITTVPANVTPQVAGQGSICLIDPADNGCKSTVTIPGKGTFVLNSNGTVTFTAVAGFIGTVTVQLQITSAYGQVARGPITFIVGPTSQLQTGATTGTAPVNLAPSTKPEPGSACLIDPSDEGCKSKVTVPSVGTWNLNTNTGAVTFQAVSGYVGTTIVQYRVKRAGFEPTFTPFVVTVAKKRPPVTVTIGGFNPGSPILTKAIKNQITAFMKAYVGYKTVECIGFTMGPTVLKVDKWLSTTRATNACAFILGTLKSKVSALPLKNKMETVVGSLIRRVTLTLRD